MADSLVIVESPAKAKTIGKFLGSHYKVVASNGHVRDLPKSQLGVDVNDGFKPKYITLRGRGEVLDRIRKEAKNAKRFIWRPTLTVRARPFPGIWQRFWAWMKTASAVSCSTKLQPMP